MLQCSVFVLPKKTTSPVKCMIDMKYEICDVWEEIKKNWGKRLVNILCWLQHKFTEKIFWLFFLQNCTVFTVYIQLTAVSSWNEHWQRNTIKAYFCMVPYTSTMMNGLQWLHHIICSMYCMAFLMYCSKLAR